MSDTNGRERRELFETSGNRIYETVAARGGLPIDDTLFTEDAPAVAATRLLLEMGLLTEDGDRYLVNDPHTVQASVVGPLGQQGASMIQAASDWSQVFAELGQAFRRSPATEDGPITRLTGDQIERFLADVVPHARTELLTAQPQTGRSAAALKVAAERDVGALQRGVSMRTIYQHAARRSRATRAYVARVTENGGEVRTLDEFFNRLIVVDREIALIPSGDDFKVALAIRDTALVAYLVDIFERFWDRGRPFESQATSTLDAIAAEQRAMAIRMLIEGHSDATCAKRLGVSPRTYAGYVADLKKEYDTQTRFQLGYRMGQQHAKENRQS